jgi:molybdenum cofactor synthesis domain-containing protein
MKASILGVGTEITTGQILNSNGQWISKMMTQLGVEVKTHIVVPDDHKLIYQSLDFCAKHSDIIFVTGGLGPTTDDFTRDVVAKWTRQKMKFDRKSLKKIEARFAARGVPMREFQKQQCFYPEKSKILENTAGTANAFYVEARKKKIFVLPGPPREIEVIWNDHLEKIFLKLTKHIDRIITKSWKCVGHGESEVSHRVETALKGCRLTKGYRFHHPYVEVKLSYYESESKSALKWIKKVEEAIGDITEDMP